MYPQFLLAVNNSLSVSPIFNSFSTNAHPGVNALFVYGGHFRAWSVGPCADLRWSDRSLRRFSFLFACFWIGWCSDILYCTCLGLIIISALVCLFVFFFLSVLRLLSIQLFTLTRACEIRLYFFVVKLYYVCVSMFTCIELTKNGSLLVFV